MSGLALWASSCGMWSEKHSFLCSRCMRYIILYNLLETTRRKGCANTLVNDDTYLRRLGSGVNGELKANGLGVLQSRLYTRGCSCLCRLPPPHLAIVHGLHTSAVD